MNFKVAIIVFIEAIIAISSYCFIKAIVIKMPPYCYYYLIVVIIANYSCFVNSKYLLFQYSMNFEELGYFMVTIMITLNSYFNP